MWICWKTIKKKSDNINWNNFVIPANIYLLKVNNKNAEKRCQIYSKLTIKTPEQRHWYCSGDFIVNLNLFHKFFSDSIVNFEQVNVSLDSKHFKHINRNHFESLNNRDLPFASKVTQNLYSFCNLHCVKSVRIRSYSGPHFPAFGLNMERYGVFLRI